MTELRWETDADGNLAFKDDDGNTILRLNQDGSIDEVKSLTTEDASVANTPTDATDVARKTEIDAKADDPHTLGGLSHDADTLANLNDKISDAVLDDSGDARAPTSHAPTHVTGGTDALGLNDFALPEGAYVDEEGGDLVIRDSSNAIVLRRDEAASEWVMDSVSTGDLDIGGADFVAQGDVICVGSWGPPSERTASTTNTTFTTVGGFSSMLPIWDGLIPAGGTPVVGMTVRFNPGDGETMTGAYINNDEAVEIVSVTGESGSGSREWSGWVEYEPADTATPTDVLYKHKVDTGLNSSTSIYPTFYLGVQL